MPLLGGAFADADQDASRLAGFKNDHDLIGLGASKVGSDEVLAPLFLGRVQNGCARLAGAALHPVVVLSGDVPEDLTADRVKLAVAPEEAHHPFGLLKGLDGSVEQKAVEAAIGESNVMLMVLAKGVHGFLPRCEIPAR